MIFIIFGLLALTVALIYFRKWKTSIGLRKNVSFGMFHPYCNMGGGGEKVLWFMVHTILTKIDDSQVYIYTDGEFNKKDLLHKVHEQFHMKIADRIRLIPLKSCNLLKSSNYPYLTLILHNLGSMIVGLEALISFKPDVLVETLGFPFLYPLFKFIAFSKVVAYVHYPIITTEMIKFNKNKLEYYANNKFISRTGIIGIFRVFYYYTVSMLYYFCGKCTDKVIVNSTWTYSHISTMWGVKNTYIEEQLKDNAGSVKNESVACDTINVVYPPCTQSKCEQFYPNDETSDKIKDMIEGNREPFILSIGQFRPEKDHITQLVVFKDLLDKLDDSSLKQSVKMIMIGGCRNDSDRNRVDDLKQLAVKFGIENQVKFICNATVDKIQMYLKTCSIGLHTMKFEHFGITVAEMVANGLIVVAHKSGGPLSDIIPNYYMQNENMENVSGFLASSVDEYVMHLHTILNLENKIVQNIRRNAIQGAKLKFSETAFIENISNIFTNFCRQTNIAF